MQDDYYEKSERVKEIEKVATRIVLILDEISEIDQSTYVIKEEVEEVEEALKQFLITKPEGTQQDMFNKTIQDTIYSLWDNRNRVIIEMKYERFKDIINIFENGSKESNAD